MVKASLSDDVVKIGIVVVGGLAIYSLIQVRDLANYGSTKVDDAQSWGSKGWSKFWGAPKYFWDERFGQGGIRLTGNEPISTDDRGLFKKDEGSWLWGWGPKK